jgi:hypothetical protein
LGHGFLLSLSGELFSVAHKLFALTFGQGHEERPRDRDQIANLGSAVDAFMSD